MSDKFKGHARGTIVKQSRNDSSGYFLQWHGMIVAQCMTKPNAELFAAAPELLAENERLRTEVEFLQLENSCIKSTNRRLEVEAIQRQGEFDRPRLSAKAENEHLRARVAELEGKLGSFDI